MIVKAKVNVYGLIFGISYFLSNGFIASRHYGLAIGLGYGLVCGGITYAAIAYLPPIIERFRRHITTH
jgi:hypothetical protein